MKLKVRKKTLGNPCVFYVILCLDHIHTVEATSGPTSTSNSPRSHILLLSTLYPNQSKLLLGLSRVLSGCWCWTETDSLSRKKVIQVWVVEVQVWHHQGVLWLRTLFWERGGNWQHLNPDPTHRRREEGREGGRPKTCYTVWCYCYFIHPYLFGETCT